MRNSGYPVNTLRRVQMSKDQTIYNYIYNKKVVVTFGTLLYSSNADILSYYVYSEEQIEAEC